MAQLLVRNLDDHLVEKLKRRAAANGRSAEAEHRAILENALGANKAAWLAEAQAFREAQTPFDRDESTDIIREFRDSR